MRIIPITKELKAYEYTICTECKTPDSYKYFRLEVGDLKPCATLCKDCLDKLSINIETIK